MILCVEFVHDVVESGLVHGTRDVAIQQVYKLRCLALGEIPTESGDKGALYKLGVIGKLVKRPQTFVGNFGATRGQHLDEILQTHLVNNLLVVSSERLTGEHLFLLVAYDKPEYLSDIKLSGYCNEQSE